MAKVSASLKDVQTKFENAPPDRYRLKIVEVKETNEKADPPNQDKNRQNFNVKLVINDGGEHNGKPIYHNISMHKKDGEVNRAGQADLKRFFEAVLGIDPEDTTYDWDSVDTDMLVNQEVEGDVIIEKWSKNGKSGESNRLRSTSITAVGAGS